MILHLSCAGDRTCTELSCKACKTCMFRPSHTMPLRQSLISRRPCAASASVWIPTVRVEHGLPKLNSPTYTTSRRSCNCWQAECEFQQDFRSKITLIPPWLRSGTSLRSVRQGVIGPCASTAPKGRCKLEDFMPRFVCLFLGHWILFQISRLRAVYRLCGLGCLVLLLLGLRLGQHVHVPPLPMTAGIGNAKHDPGTWSHARAK